MWASQSSRFAEHDLEKHMNEQVNETVSHRFSPTRYIPGQETQKYIEGGKLV